MKWGLWSTAAASNSATPPDGWPEGQAPSTVNDCAREMMASIRTGVSDIQFIDLGVTPTQTGNTTFTLAGNQMQWYPYGNRVKANVGGVNKYGTIISSTFTTNTGITLRFDNFGDALTTSLSAVAAGFPQANNGALPDNAYKPLNPIMNACHDFWSRGNGPFSISGAAATYTSDRWLIAISSTAGVSMVARRYEASASASNVPTVAQAGFLINSALGLSVNGAMAVLNAGTYAGIFQRIEGYTFRQLAQKPMTAQFWINSRQTGTYCLTLTNAGSDQTICLPFSISSVATWEKKTIQIPKSPSGGTWDYSTGIGLQVGVILACGSGLQGGGGNWTATQIVATAAQTNFLASAGNLIMMTGVKLNEGIFATPLDAVDAGIETARIRRFVRRWDLGGGITRYPAQAVNAAQCYFTINFEDMRVAPTAVTPLPTGVGILNAGLVVTAISAMVQVGTGGTGCTTFLVTQAGAGNLTQGQVAFLGGSSGVAIVLSAEL